MPHCTLMLLAKLQVADLFVVRIAAQQALAQQQRGKLITKSLHAELVYNMSGSRHVSISSVLLQMCLHSASVRHQVNYMVCQVQISESFNRFGVSESCQHLLVARFDAEPAQVKKACVSACLDSIAYFTSLAYKTGMGSLCSCKQLQSL